MNITFTINNLSWSPNCNLASGVFIGSGTPLFQQFLSAQWLMYEGLEKSIKHVVNDHISKGSSRFSELHHQILMGHNILKSSMDTEVNKMLIDVRSNSALSLSSSSAPLESSIIHAPNTVIDTDLNLSSISSAPLESSIIHAPNTGIDMTGISEKSLLYDYETSMDYSIIRGVGKIIQNEDTMQHLERVRTLQINLMAAKSNLDNQCNTKFKDFEKNLKETKGVLDKKLQKILSLSPTKNILTALKYASYTALVYKISYDAYSIYNAETAEESYDAMMSLSYTFGSYAFGKMFPQVALPVQAVLLFDSLVTREYTKAIGEYMADAIVASAEYAYESLFGSSEDLDVAVATSEMGVHNITEL